MINLLVNWPVSQIAILSTAKHFFSMGNSQHSGKAYKDSDFTVHLYHNCTETHHGCKVWIWYFLNLTLLWTNVTLATISYLRKKRSLDYSKWSTLPTDTGEVSPYTELPYVLCLVSLQCCWGSPIVCRFVWSDPWPTFHPHCNLRRTDLHLVWRRYFSSITTAHQHQTPRRVLCHADPVLTGPNWGVWWVLPWAHTGKS